MQEVKSIYLNGPLHLTVCTCKMKWPTFCYLNSLLFKLLNSCLKTARDRFIIIPFYLVVEKHENRKDFLVIIDRIRLKSDILVLAFPSNKLVLMMLICTCAQIRLQSSLSTDILLLLLVLPLTLYPLLLFFHPLIRLNFVFFLASPNPQ